MAHHHPIGTDHPFPQVHALAQREGFDALEIMNVYDGALIRLYVRKLDIVFKLEGDPGSAMDRQRFDYYTQVTLPAAPADQLLQAIKDHITRVTMG